MDALEKYYIPTIEEFHVGFEYEINNPRYQGDTFYEEETISSKNIVSVLSNWKYFKEYRVKYLDQEDIESLKFKFKQTNKIRNWYVLESSFNIPGDYTVHKCTIIHDPEFKSISITENIGGTEETLFQGWCKNKSELKRILKMIGYGI